MMIPVPCATCGGETEKRVYPDVTNAEHVPKCTRPALPPAGLTRVQRSYVTLRAEEGEPGNEARVWGVATIIVWRQYKIL